MISNTLLAAAAVAALALTTGAAMAQNVNQAANGPVTTGALVSHRVSSLPPHQAGDGCYRIAYQPAYTCQTRSGEVRSIAH